MPPVLFQLGNQGRVPRGYIYGILAVWVSDGHVNSAE